MHFYVDESGHTGPNLFDAEQPTLYYGVLSSTEDVDTASLTSLEVMRQRCSVDHLHAAELGVNGLLPIASDLERLQRDLRLRFELHLVRKPDHAVISFFDQVFDQGLNPAMTWTGYWTPLRFVVLIKVAMLFDEQLAQQAWEARLERNDSRANSLLVSICGTLLARLQLLPDARSRELLRDVLRWAQENPEALHYNAKSKEDRLGAMPNVIAFQSVIHGISSLLRELKVEATRLVVDQQSQFNRPQRSLADFYTRAPITRLINGFGLPEMDLSSVPRVPIEFVSSSQSAGLELVDLYLWISRRALEGRVVPEPIMQLMEYQNFPVREISLRALAEYWEERLSVIPEPTAEQAEKAREMIALDEAREMACR